MVSILKYEYELSVWKETLAKEGQRKEEKKMAIIGAHDMTFLGKATKLKFIKKINGTHTLSFEMPDKYFDSEKGEYVHNEFVDYLFSECKIKFHYKGEWYEFYIKSVSDKKIFKSFIKTYTCSDSFIDELSRNGYGITFDEELYNNVEEIGDFSKEILEDSVWEYDAHLNWGDFTEYLEEKLLRIPLSLFDNGLTASKLNYFTNSTEKIYNIFTKESRPLEMGDDLSREKNIFWDGYDNALPLRGDSTTLIDGYIYVPYSQLDFCYVSSDNEQQNGLDEAFAATEYPANYDDRGYAIAPSSVDPTALIQFIYIPENSVIEIDEAGLIVNKDYTYVMTVKEWNEQIHSKYFYYFEDYKKNGFKYKELKEKSSATPEDYIHGNWAAYYNGYLSQLGDLEVEKGKKISISNHTEINISDEVDQYVTVYKNKADEYTDLYSNEDWQFNPIADKDYRVCSKIETRQIVPQLARNLVQNGQRISTSTGWEIMNSQLSSINNYNASIDFKYIEESNVIEVPEAGYSIDIGGIKESYLTFIPAYRKVNDVCQARESTPTEINAMANFGIVGQEKKIEKDKTYAIGINIRKTIEEVPVGISGNLSDTFIRIGTGQLVSDGDYEFKDSEYIDIPLSKFGLTADGVNKFLLFKTNKTYDNPYIAIYSTAAYDLVSLVLFEAYTKGIDQFENGYFKYSGRDLFNSYTPLEENGYNYSNAYAKDSLVNFIIFEDDVMPGDTYEYRRYFIQALRLKESEQYFDTYKAKAYLDEDGYEDQLPLDAGTYTEDDYEIITNYIDLNQCEYYDSAAAATGCDCGFGNGEKICLYQKYGYCPYRFTAEKHCRKIRTLKGEKSNRFNLTQELGKTFSIYPMYWTGHHENGRVLTQQEAVDLGIRHDVTPGRADWMDKRLFYITEKGKVNQLGFRYEKNLQDISRTINSDKIVSKLYVLDVDSDISKTGLSSIKTAEDNPSKDNFIIDFSYYIAQGLLDKDTTNADLYGVDESDLGYLKTLGYYNIQYDRLSNLMINLSAQSFTELKGNLDVNLTGIETAQKKLRQLEKRLSQYAVKSTEEELKENSTYNSYKYEYMEQYSIYIQLIADTFYTNGVCIYGDSDTCEPSKFLGYDGGPASVDEIKKQWVDTHSYEYGILGQYNKEYKQLKEWKKEQASYLKKINQLSADFYRKYEPYLKEGTWSDSNYISDNAYYFGAVDAAKEGAIPKVSYSINLADIEPIDRQGDYIFDVADTTYVEDIGLFGINKKTGLPNRLKTIVSETEENPDEPLSNKINVQDFTTQFDDLFQQVTATVQSLTFNENIYKRSSNFTAQQNIKTESLQGALDENNLDLVNTQESNIQINQYGQAGSDINNHTSKYILDGQGLRFSNNGGQSWNTAITPNGINTDFLRAGTIDASKIKIVDGKYVYFSWDMEGITAYRDPSTLSDTSKAFGDYARFNKYGLSLVENGNIKLRAGYAFKPGSAENPADASREQDISEDSPIGFYLYNSAGKAIFATENSSTDSAVETARINLIGEMLASNSAEITNFYGYRYGGTSYAREVYDCMDLGNGDDLLTTVTPQISGSVATFEKPASATASNSDYAALIAHLYREDSLTEIVIIDGADSISFENPQVSYKWDGFGKIEVDSETRYINYQNWSAKFTNQSEQEYAIIEGASLVFKGLSQFNSIEKFVFTIVTGDYGYSDIKLSKDATLTGVDIDNRNTDSTLSYYYYQDQTIRNLYKIENEYFSEYIDEQYYTDDGAVALYINNRQDLTAEAQPNSRLFVCCKGIEDNVSNIFSILKDGSLHMGGIIKDQDSATQLTDVIEIEDEYLVIDADGKFKMSFDDIVDIKTEQSIADYVANQLSDAESRITQDLVARSHRHYVPESEVGWERPTSLEHQTYGDINFSDITITLSFDNEGTDTDISMSLEEFLNRINYYGTLTYGLVYTDYSNI